MSLSSQIESLLFIAGRPLSVKKLSELTEHKSEEVEKSLLQLKEKYNRPENGVQLMQNGKEYQLITNPENSKLVKDYIQDETTGELTRPSLETLTIIAYRGPLTKPELEQIRGVNCSLILRNLLMRGLIKEEEDKTRVQLVYSVTVDFLRFLGIRGAGELPDFQRLNGSNLLQKLMEEINQESIS